MKSFYTLAAAALVGLAAAQNYTTSTVYTTQEITVTSCAPTITNCPAESTVLTTITVAAYTTICPVTATMVPTSAAAPSFISSSSAVPTYVKYVSRAPVRDGFILTMNSSTIPYSSCPSSFATSTPGMMTRSAVSTPGAGTATMPLFTSIPATGASVTVAPTGSPIATVKPGAAPKIAGGVVGSIVLMLAAFAL
ncbi:hypothetical protein MMC27_004975 [Xylographa pallens]|nr:hypothetical protein [Xylographa pallens]